MNSLGLGEAETYSSLWRKSWGICNDIPRAIAKLVSTENKARTCDLKFRTMSKLN